jgi:hypothetical protein
MKPSRGWSTFLKTSVIKAGHATSKVLDARSVTTVATCRFPSSLSVCVTAAAARHRRRRASSLSLDAIYHSVRLIRTIMKKGHGLQRVVPVIPEKRLFDLPTKQLLGRLKRLRFCEESFQGSDLSEEEIQSCAGILFKETPEWKTAYEAVKRVLATREHIPKKRVKS